MEFDGIKLPFRNTEILITHKNVKSELKERRSLGHLLYSDRKKSEQLSVGKHIC